MAKFIEEKNLLRPHRRNKNQRQMLEEERKKGSDTVRKGGNSANPAKKIKWK